ncbi:MAG: hypothetical protein QM648_08470 [Solirubrobacterales bacterium]
MRRSLVLAVLLLLSSAALPAAGHATQRMKSAGLVDGRVDFDGGFAYWVESGWVRGKTGRWTFRNDVVRWDLKTGRGSAIFSTKRFELGEVSAGGGRVLFSAMRTTSNRTHLKTKSRLYVVEPGASSAVLVAKGNSTFPRSAAPAALGANRWCGKVFMVQDVSEGGEIAYEVLDAGSCHGKQQRATEMVFVQAAGGEPRAYPTGSGDYGDLTYVNGRRLGTEDLDDDSTRIFDRDTGETVELPKLGSTETVYGGWRYFLVDFGLPVIARGSDTAFLVQSERAEGTSAVLLTHGGVFNPFARFKLAANSAADVALCGPGAVVLRARQREITTSDNYTQFPGSGPLTLFQLGTDARVINKSTFSHRPIEGIGCDTQNAYLVVETKRRPAVQIRPLAAWD